MLKRPSGLFRKGAFLLTSAVRMLVANEIGYDATVHGPTSLCLVGRYRLVFSITLGSESLGSDAEVFDDELLDAVGAPFGKCLVVCPRVSAVGMAGNLAVRRGEFLEEITNGLQLGMILRLDIVFVAVEINHDNGRLVAEPHCRGRRWRRYGYADGCRTLYSAPLPFTGQGIDCVGVRRNRRGTLHLDGTNNGKYLAVRNILRRPGERRVLTLSNGGRRSRQIGNRCRRSRRWRWRSYNRLGFRRGWRRRFGQLAGGGTAKGDIHPCHIFKRMLVFSAVIIRQTP